MRNGNSSASDRVVPLHRGSGNDDDSDDGAMLVEGHKARVPDGWYQAKYLGHSTALMWAKAAKVFLKFEIVDETSQYNGTQLFRPYRVRRIDGRPGPNGKFVLAAGGDLYRTLAKLLDTKARSDRISLRALKHMLFRIKSRTVDRGPAPERRELPEPARYSVIDDVEDGR